MSGVLNCVSTYVLQEKFSFSKKIRYEGGKGKLGGLKVSENEYKTILLVTHEQRPDNDKGRKFDYRICLKQGSIEEVDSDENNETGFSFLMSEIQKYRFSSIVSVNKWMTVVLKDKKSKMKVSFPTRHDMSIVRKFLETNQDDVKREKVLKDPLPGRFICEKIFPKNFSIPSPECEMWTTEEFIFWLQVIPIKADSFGENRYFYVSLFDHLEANEESVIEFIRTLEHPFEVIKTLCQEKSEKISKEARDALGRHFYYLTDFFKGMFDIRFYTILWKRPENRKIGEVERSLLTDLSSTWNLSDMKELILFSWLAGVDYRTWIHQKLQEFKEFCASEEASHKSFLKNLHHFNRLHKVDLQIYDIDIFRRFMEEASKDVPWNDILEEIKKMEIELEFYNKFFEEHDALFDEKCKLEDENKPTDEVDKKLEEVYCPYLSEYGQKKSLIRYNISKKRCSIITEVKRLLFLLDSRRKEAIRKMNREAKQELKGRGGMNLKVKLVMSRCLGQSVGNVERRGVRFLNRFLAIDALRFGFLHSYITVVNVGIHWFDRALCFIGGGGKGAALSKIMQEKYETICCLDVTCPKAYDDVSIVQTADKVARFLLDCNLNKFYSNIGRSRDHKFNCQEFSIKLLKELDAVYPVHRVEMEFIRRIRNLEAFKTVEDVEYFKAFECPRNFPENLRKLFPENNKFVFKTHENLDKFVRACLKEMPDFRTLFPGEYELLKGFDRAFWMALQYGKQGKEIEPLRRHGEILCPFSRRKDWDEKDFYKIGVKIDV